MLFADRVDAGRQLARALRGRVGGDAVVIGLPRGGVPVAFEVADELGAPLDVIVVRKLGVPFQPELAMGAIGEGGVRVVDEGLVGRIGLGADEWAAVEASERRQLDRRIRRLRRARAPVPVAGRTAVIVDDGIATGSTARAACRVARARGARRVVLAVPVAPGDAVPELLGDADDVVCVHQTGIGFSSVGQAYVDFTPATDDEVVALLERAALRDAAQPRTVLADAPRRDEDILISAGGGCALPGHLAVPAEAAGIVIFAHGSGSSRHSPRNRHVAAALRARGLGTLLLDLLTGEEERDRRNVFDIDLLAGRLLAAAAWVAHETGLPHRIGYFGASTGAAAALVAAAGAGPHISAVVCRGGRPDLAGDALPKVSAPTLLIVGGADREVLRLNRFAQARMRCRNRLTVVPGATHLFGEAGALDTVAGLAADWFTTCFDHTARPRLAARSG